MYYVRDGQINDYALNFVVPVPANVRDITFTWESLEGRPLPYTIDIQTSDREVLPKPTMNITYAGEVPEKTQTFAIQMRCSGVRASEVEVKIVITVILNRMTKEKMELVFRRKKICLMEEIVDNDIETDPLLLETAIQPQNGLITLIVGGVLALVLVSILIVIAYCARGPVKRQNHGQPMRTSSFQRIPASPPSIAPSMYMSPSVIVPMHNEANSLPRKVSPKYQNQTDDFHNRISDITVERCRVRLSNLIQEGTYGRVYKGTYNDNEQVIVKTVAQHASQMQVSLLLQEGMSLYGASHPSIVSVLGISIDDHSSPFVLYPGGENSRNLKLFLQDPACARSITTIQIVLMSSQLSSALQHLHSHGVVHKDIAARNCVIDDQLRVKLSDSSLSRDLFPGDYNCLGDSENRPIKWMSLEALQKKQFTEASDVWAFGVFMWELCTAAKQPYAEVDPFEMEHYIKDGYRLAQPFNCPDEL